MKRNVVVSINSPNKLKIKLSDYTVIQGGVRFRAKMRIKLDMPGKNWTKNWVATDVSPWTHGRARQALLYHVIEGLLKDPEFIANLRVR